MQPFHLNLHLVSCTDIIEPFDAPHESIKHPPSHSGDISLGECQKLALHLNEAFGVTTLLPRICTTLLHKAQGDGAVGDKPITTYAMLMKEREQWPNLWD